MNIIPVRFAFYINCLVYILS